MWFMNKSSKFTECFTRTIWVLLVLRFDITHNQNTQGQIHWHKYRNAYFNTIFYEQLTITTCITFNA